MAIQKGDQYAIPVKVTMGNTTITPENCTDVRIKIADKTKSYVEGTLTFDSTSSMWEYAVTQDDTRKMDVLETNLQVGVKIGNIVTYSQVQKITVNYSIINENW